MAGVSQRARISESASASARFDLSRPALSRVDVGQGEMAISKDPETVLTATLGSCVAVVLQDRIGRIGGMTHIFQCVDPGPTGGAAVIAEIEKLMNALMRAGSPKSTLDARVIGGARTLGRGRDFGGDIARVCIDFLLTERIPVAEMEIGGRRARRLIYVPAQGTLNVSYPGDYLPDPSATAPTPRRGDPELF